METSASFEARSAPFLYPTFVGGIVGVSVSGVVDGDGDGDVAVGAGHKFDQEIRTGSRLPSEKVDLRSGR
jgi:hypothetical protein